MVDYSLTELEKSPREGWHKQQTWKQKLKEVLFLVSCIKELTFCYALSIYFKFNVILIYIYSKSKPVAAQQDSQDALYILKLVTDCNTKHI